jgi:hypothetical protein
MFFSFVHKLMVFGVAAVLIGCGGGGSSSVPAASSKAASATPVVSSIAASSASVNAVKVVAKGDYSSDARPAFYAVLGERPVDDQGCREAPTLNRLTEVMDNTLQAYVFAFHLKVNEDIDCAAERTDRQRLEVKVYGESPEPLKGREGETHYYRWKLLLPADMQVSSKFTHVFQIIGDKENTQPLVTFTAFESSDQKSQWFELRYYQLQNDGTLEIKRLQRLSLSDVTGRWLDLTVKAYYAADGGVEIKITDIANQNALADVTENNLDLFRGGTEFNRPKWGIYRSLEEKEKLRDETVWMTNVCLSEEVNDC